MLTIPHNKSFSRKDEEIGGRQHQIHRSGSKKASKMQTGLKGKQTRIRTANGNMNDYFPQWELVQVLVHVLNIVESRRSVSIYMAYGKDVDFGSIP